MPIDCVHPLEFRDRPGCLALDHLQAAIQQQGLVIDRIFRQDFLDEFFTVVVLLLSEGHVRQPAPGRQIIRGLARDFLERLPGGFQVAGLDLEVGVSEPPRGSNGRKVGRGLEGLVGLPRVILHQVKGPQNLMRRAGFRIQNQGFFDLVLRRFEVLLPELEKAQRHMVPRSPPDLRRQFVKPLLCVLHVLRGDGRFHQQQQGVIVRRLLVQNVNRFVARLLQPRQVETGQPQLQSRVQIVRPQLLGFAQEGKGRGQPPLLETHQTPDGGVRIPQALRPYLDGLEELSPSG